MEYNRSRSLQRRAAPNEGIDIDDLMTPIRSTDEIGQGDCSELNRELNQHRILFIRQMLSMGSGGDRATIREMMRNRRLQRFRAQARQRDEPERLFDFLDW